MQIFKAIIYSWVISDVYEDKNNPVNLNTITIFFKKLFKIPV